MNLYLCNKCHEHTKKEDMNFDTEYDCDLCNDCTDEIFILERDNVLDTL